MEPTDNSTPRISLTVVARKRIPELDRLVDTLLVVDGPAEREIIVAIETAGADHVAETRDERGVRWLAIPAKRGLGYNRNRTLEAARGEVLFGIDDDCEPDRDWLIRLLGALEHPEVHAAVGNISIPKAGFIGDSISALGFPAGGNAGYETMFPVADDGTTTNIAIGNCAIRTSTLREVGGFDESMTFGGEDTELAYRLGVAGKRIVFVPAARIVHPARTSLSEFARWSFVRGRAKAQFARRVRIGGYVGARLASYHRILRRHVTDPKIMLIAPLLFANVCLQQAGFLAETVSPTAPPSSV